MQKSIEFHCKILWLSSHKPLWIGLLFPLILDKPPLSPEAVGFDPRILSMATEKWYSNSPIPIKIFKKKISEWSVKNI